MVREDRRAWLLNFDAEDELARPTGYTLSSARAARFQALADRVCALLRPADVVLPEPAPGQPPASFAGFIGMAWCPTPRARRCLSAVGASAPAGPELVVLRAVNHRAFSASLGQTLPGALFARTMEEVTRTISAPSPTGTWLLKRPFGFAGRGRLKIDLARPGDLRHATPWIEASLRSWDGLQVEPLVDRTADFALHGFVRESGAPVLGHPTRQLCDDSGAWLGSTRAAPGDLTREEADSLHEQTHIAAAALSRAGYFGPFGVDAFRWRDAAGHPRWNPRGEINARYSMGWPAGMGDVRPDLDTS